MQSSIPKTAQQAWWLCCKWGSAPLWRHTKMNTIAQMILIMYKLKGNSQKMKQQKYLFDQQLKI